MSAPTTTQVTFADLLALLFPAGTEGYLKLVSGGSSRQEEYWFRNQQGILAPSETLRLARAAHHWISPNRAPGGPLLSARVSPFQGSPRH